MSHSDRLKAWAARKRERTQPQPQKKTTSPVVARSAASRDQALRELSFELVEQRNGQLYPKGSSVTVKQIAFLHAVAQKSAVEIVAQFARTLTFAQCHAALSYYYLHQDEVDADLRRDREFNAPGVLAGTGRLPRLGLEELSRVIEG